MKLNELIEKRLIASKKTDHNDIVGSLKIAERFLERAKGNMRLQYYDIAFTLAYSVMFHTARALLFKTGYKERSHYALIEALRQTCKDKENQSFIDALDSYRLTRHAIQYKGELCSQTDAARAIKDAQTFLTHVKKQFRT